MSSARLWANSCPVKRIDHNVYASQCPECGKLHYPRVLRCKQCGYRRYPEDQTELYWSKRGYKSWPDVVLAGPCELLTFTTLWNLPMGFDQLSLDFGVVQFPSGLRALGQLKAARPTLGMQLIARPGVIRSYPTHNEWGLHLCDE